MSQKNIQAESFSEVYASNVFSQEVMRERLPKKVYKSLVKTIDERTPLDPAIADVVANAMKDWAIEKGATHYTHWFQPMTGMTAEKHDSFISPDGRGGNVMEFSGKELIQGEPDASSFPSGGLRVTFEARGYTAWDCTSPVFIKEDGDNISLFIPSAFCSYTSVALDKKTPLLRSMDALNEQTMRILRALGNTTSKSVLATLGSEQEYFLIDRKFAEKRLDLLMAGRTLFGAPAPKGQEMSDHYFGNIHERIASYMHEVNIELWKLGVSAKTQHNEVAPAQYEIAPVFATVNVSTDHNQLTMETLKKVARRHGLVCLLHEKPFAGLNGSGKHVNWSIVTDDGINLLDPGVTPHDNEVFMVILMGIIKAVDEHAHLLRASVATSSNDHRLGGHEAPPAIVSIFLGEQLTDILEQIASGGAKSSKKGGEIRLGVSTLPPFPKDVTDRNRTSPFAFTGNRFEFRMPGSSISTSGPCFILNTVVADVLREIADELEKSNNVHAAAQKVLKRIVKENSRIIFNGDNYTEEWVTEAGKRGLPNLKNAVDALDTVSGRDTIALFKRHRIFSKEEYLARVDIILEQYAQTITIEARAALQIAKRQILPVAIEYATAVATSVSAVQDAGGSSRALDKKLDEITRLIDELDEAIETLEEPTGIIESLDNTRKAALFARDKLMPGMKVLREVVDAFEEIVDAELWPLPTYAEMLFMR